jgi:hypothetical protein
MDLTMEQLMCIIFCAKLGKNVMETLPIIRQVFGEEGMSPA